MGRITHGKTANRFNGHKIDKTYKAWRGMKDRCYLKTHDSYPRYGGRGIKVCARWKDSFENFYLDMGEPPTKDHTLDRIENAKDYGPDNCRWATKREQANNRSSNTLIYFDGKFMTLSQVAKLTGIHRCTITYRLNNGLGIFKESKQG